MARSIYVPEAGGFIDFSDDASDTEISSYLRSRFSAPVTQQTAPPAPAGPDESGIGGRFAYGFATGLTDIPGGIAALLYPAEEAAKTSAGQFSEEARKYLQETFGIDPTKDPTAAQQAAQALGSVGSFFVPGSAAAKVAGLAGRGVAAAARVGTATAAAQGVALGAEQRAETIRQQLASGMQITEEQQLAAQRMSGFIGALDAAPLAKFFGPLTQILSKVPLSQAPMLNKIVQSRLGRITRAGLEEGAQEVASGVANDIMEAGIYNPDVQIGQDILSNAGTGAFAGSFVEGLVQLAAGRKLRPFKQLQSDLLQESRTNTERLRQGQISQAAENIRQTGVEGSVDIEEDEFDGLPVFNIKSPTGDVIARFNDQDGRAKDNAIAAVNLYAKNTGIKVTPNVIKKKPDVEAEQPDEEAIEKDPLSAVVPSPKISTTPTETPSVEAPKVRAETPAVEAPAIPEEMPIGSVELPVEEPRYIEDIVSTAPTTISEEIETPPEGGRIEMRPSATADQLTDLQRELFGEPINVTKMTPEQRSVYDAERDKRFPPVPETVYYSAKPASGSVSAIQPIEAAAPERGAGVQAADVITPKSLREAYALGPRVGVPTRQVAAKFEKIYTDLQSRLSTIAPSETVLGLKEFIESERPNVLIEGQHDNSTSGGQTKSIIDLATGIYDPNLSTEDLLKKLLDVLNHEVIHAIRRNGLIRQSEWRILSRAVSETKIPGKQYTYLDKAQAVYRPEVSEVYADPDAVVEEAVAEMYKDWVRLGKSPIPTRGLFNRISEFFRRIFRVLRDNNYQTVFEAIESGEVRDRDAAPVEGGARFSASPIYDPKESSSDWETGGAPPPGISSVNKTGGSPFRISQRRPTTKKEVGKSLSSNLKIDVKAMQLEPGQLEYNIALVRDYVGFPKKEGETADQTLKRFKKHVVDNLLWLHDLMDPDLRSRAKLWYDGARAIADDLAAKYNLPDTTVAAVMAGLSPQKDWFQNVSLAERVIDIVKTQQNTVFDSDMLSHARTRPALAKYDLILQAMEGVEFKDLSKIDFASVLARKHNEINAGLYSKAQIEMMNKNGVGTLAKAIFVRIYDEVNNPRSFNIITPEGQKAGPMLTTKGVESKVAWNGFTDIGKAITAIEDGTKETIDTLLGSYHKVRNFYNNILSPKSTDGSVTMDTHAIAAALLRALAGTADEVSHNFGTLATKNSGKTGVQGLYAVYADAYRDAAKLRGILPREMQSITWEAVRGLYKATFKSQDKNVDAIDAIWRLHSNGKITAREARKRILDLADPGAKGINSPFWKGTPSTVIYGVGGPALNTAGVVGLGVRQAAARTGGGGVGTDAGDIERAKPGVRFSAAPLTTHIQSQNQNLFKEPPKLTFSETVFDYLFGYKPASKERMFTAIRANLVDNAAFINLLEKKANQQDTGNFERRVADFSPTFSFSQRRRSSQLTASSIMMGPPEINFADPGNIMSATVKIKDSQENLMKVFEAMMQPGPIDPNTGKPTDLREVFKTYATAKRGQDLRARGMQVPQYITPQYIREALDLIPREYPQIVEAYNMYQRINKEMLTAARDSGLISTAELGRLTRDMNYYGFYREVFQEELIPSSSTKTAGEFKLREYTGSEAGGLINDPMYVIIRNTQFWIDSITKNLASVKSFELARRMGEAKLLGTGQSPDLSRGFQKDIMYFKKNGVLMRFAVKDPLMVTALGADDRVVLGKAIDLLGMPASIIRETVTRDPAFMIANLLRDTLSSWITSGEDIKPFIGTAKGMVSALKQSASFKDLMGRGIVGSYDMGMMDAAQIASKIRRRTMPKNIHTVASAEGAIGVLQSLWDRLGALSEASDAATRIAVYEAARAQGLSEAEATMRAQDIMDFSRRGASQLLNILTKTVPFLNARIQGLDVLYQSAAAGKRFVMGQSLGERDENLGKKFLVRGLMLAALSVALEMYNEDDEDYKQLSPYIKDGNLLIPLRDFGLPGEFVAIPKPFESGLLFSTFPQMMYKYFVSGDATNRDAAKLFFSQFASTFGVNPLPQILIPPLEVIMNHDFYTGLPLISEGKLRLDPSLQYDSRTSTLAMLINKIPFIYDYNTGEFRGPSPIAVDTLINGYTGPVGSYIVMALGAAMTGFDAGPEKMPTEISEYPVIKRFFVDAKAKNPAAVTEAYELFRMVDEANRTFSRLRQANDAEALLDYYEEKKDVLAYKKYVYKLVDRLNKLSAYERQIERDKEMTNEEKIAAKRNLRDLRIRVTAQVEEINKKLGR